MSATIELRSVVEHYIGGGWGHKTARKNFRRVRVIRGTDFSKVVANEFGDIPVRYEKSTKIPQRELIKGDILIEGSGGSPTNRIAVGKVIIIEDHIISALGSSIPASFCKLLRINKSKYRPRFVYYVLSKLYASDDIWKYQTPSTGIINLNFEYYLDNVQLPNITLEEQDEVIAAIFPTERWPRLLQQSNKTLEAIAQALFRAWFVDFEPVRAKMAAREHGRDETLAAVAALSGRLRVPRGGAPITAAALDEAIEATGALEWEQMAHLTEVAEAFPGGFEESSLGMIPEGWAVVALGELVDINPKYRLKRNAEARYVDMKSLPTSGHRISDVSHRPFKGGMKFKNGDAIVARITPCLENGKAAYVDCLGKGEVAAGSTEFIVMRSKEGVAEALPYLLARSDDFRTYAISHLTGTSGRQRVGKDSIAGYELAMPISGNLFALFNVPIKILFDSMRRNASHAETLAETRGRILPQLINQVHG